MTPNCALRLYLDLADATDLWARAEPGLGGTVVVALIAGAAIVAVYWFLAHEPTPEAPEPRLPVGLEAQRAAIAAARARLDEELAGVDAAVRAAFASLLAGPLRDLDRRVEALLHAAVSLQASFARAEPPLASRRAQLTEQLEAETDPCARALLQATLDDVERSLAVDAELRHRLRLTRLELDRLRTLLEALPARVRELEARRALDQEAPLQVSDIAQQLEQAVACTGRVLEDVLPPTHPLERTS